MSRLYMWMHFWLQFSVQVSIVAAITHHHPSAGGKGIMKRYALAEMTARAYLCGGPGELEDGYPAPD